MTNQQKSRCFKGSLVIFISLITFKHASRSLLRQVYVTPLRCVPVIFWDLCWLMLALCWLMLALCWLMLALCWLMLDQVGSSWLMLAQVGPSWPQDASMLAPKSQKITGTHLPRPPKDKKSSMFDQKFVFLEHPESSKY